MLFFNETKIKLFLYKYVICGKNEVNCVPFSSKKWHIININLKANCINNLESIV